MSSQQHNSRAIDTPLPQEKIFLKTLFSIIYYTPIANGNKILAEAFHHIVKHQKKYVDVLNKTEFVFSQHSGAVMVNACFLLALERSTERLNMRYLTELLKPVSRLFIVSGGRPNINVRVLFEQGNTTPAYGFYGNEDNDDDEGREDDEDIDISLYARIMKLGPPIQAHHILMHDPVKTGSHFHPKTMLIIAKAFPPDNNSPSLFSEEENNANDKDRQSDYDDPLAIPLEAMAKPVNGETSSSSPSGGENGMDLISQVKNVKLNCYITTYNEDHKDIEMLQKYIRNDPLPFLIHAVLRGSSVS